MTARRQRPGHSCPHCQSRATIYSSRRLSPLVTEQYAQCTNLACGCQFVMQLGIVRMTMPSATPNAEINLPLVARRDNDILIAPRKPTPRKVSPRMPAVTVIDGKTVPVIYR
ncbi:ogr/Delta-like zinc finger family protein [Luteibacter sp. 1214]|uniref:ogr/Delta-like zinc finger family protein n=1 Tax=Luteibacter sp. 1214 TaxID=2817735 RepID=UPI00286B7457|nr:ogr/Delta-like zinc finger family protein [Luteibacter sp. 1214]